MGVTVEVVELLNMVESLAKYAVLVEKKLLYRHISGFLVLILVLLRFIEKTAGSRQVKVF